MATYPEVGIRLDMGENLNINETGQKILRAFEKHGPCSVDEAAHQAGTSTHTVYVHLRKLKQAGLLKKVGSKGYARTTEDDPEPGDRIKQATPARLSGRQHRVLALFADKRPRHTAEIAEKLEDTTNLISRELTALCERGDLLRLRQALYAHPDTPSDVIEEAERRFFLENADRANRYQETLDLIDAGYNTLGTLRDASGISRQRADQLLKRLMSEGFIERLDTGGDAWVYTRVGQPPVPTKGEKRQETYASRILDIMPDAGWVTVATLIDQLAAPTNHRVNYAVVSLVDQGILETINRTQHTAFGSVRLTERGRQHPDRGQAPNRLAPEPLPFPNPEVTRPMVRAIAALGPQPTLALRVICGLPDTRASLYIQRYEKIGVIEEVPSYFHKTLRKYGLTTYSRAAVEAGDFEAPSHDEIADWHERIAAALRSWVGHKARTPSVITPKQQDALRFISENEPTQLATLAQHFGHTMTRTTHNLIKRLVDLTVIENDKAAGGYVVCDREFADALLENHEEAVERHLSGSL